jgi:hypothetical protein
MKPISKLAATLVFSFGALAGGTTLITDGWLTFPSSHQQIPACILAMPQRDCRTLRSARAKCSRISMPCLTGR